MKISTMKYNKNQEKYNKGKLQKIHTIEYNKNQGKYNKNKI